MENPVVLYTSHERYEIEVLKAKLEEQGIGAYIMDKQDSAYVVIGEVQLYVEAEQVEKAKDILNLNP